jgi:hypothetical protein
MVSSFCLCRTAAQNVAPAFAPQEIEGGEVGKIQAVVENQRRFDAAVRKEQTPVSCGKAAL